MKLRHHPTQALRAASGFTLIELLVVILIFGIFAVMAYGGLSGVLNTRRRIEQSLARTAEIQKAYTRLRDDFFNGSGRTIRDVDGVLQPAFVYDNYNRRLEFSRDGWSNPALLPRATEERLAYFLDDSNAANFRLIRRSWRVLDRAPQTEPVDLSLLEHVDQVQWRFLDRSNNWQTQWPPSGTQVSSSAGVGALLPPVAAELTVQTRDWGQMRLLFRFGAEGLGNGASAGSSSSSGGSTGAGS